MVQQIRIISLLLIVLSLLGVAYSQQSFYSASTQDYEIGIKYIEQQKTNKSQTFQNVQSFVYPREVYSQLIQSEVHYTGNMLAVQKPGFLSNTTRDQDVPTNLFFQVDIQTAKLQGMLASESGGTQPTIVELMNQTFTVLTPSHGQAYFDTVMFYISCNYLDELFNQPALYVQLQQGVTGFMGTLPDTVDQQNNIISWLSRIPLAKNYSGMGGLKQRQSCSNISVSCMRQVGEADLWYQDQTASGISNVTFLKQFSKFSTNTEALAQLSLGEDIKFLGDGNGYRVNRPVIVRTDGNKVFEMTEYLFSNKYPQFVIMQQGSLMLQDMQIVTTFQDVVESNLICQVKDDKGCWRYGLGIPFYYDITQDVCKLTLDGVTLFTNQDIFKNWLGFMNETQSVVNDQNLNNNFSYLVGVNASFESTDQQIKLDYFRSEGFCMINTTIMTQSSLLQATTDKVQDSQNQLLNAKTITPSTQLDVVDQAIKKENMKKILAISLPIIIFFALIALAGASFLYIKITNRRKKQQKFLDSSNSIEKKLIDGNMKTTSSTKIKALPGDFKQSNSDSNVDKDQILQKIQSLVEEIKSQKLQILEQIGRGGYGIVYKAYWNHELVAVKEILLSNEGKVQDHAILEAAISFSLKHQNLVTCKAYSVQLLKPENEPEQFQLNHVEVQQDLVKIYLIQEYCDYGTLTTHVEKKTFVDPLNGCPNLSLILQVAMDIALGCQYIHLNNVIHGDLKSNNVLLQSSENQLGFVAKLADFGLSVRLKGQQSVVSGHMAGTPFYIAPEVISHGRISKQSDVFSFGVLLWELVNGQVVYSQDEFGNNEAFPQVDAKCPLGLVQLIGLCISPKDVDRPRFSEIINYLRVLIDYSKKGLTTFGQHNIQENLDYVAQSSVIDSSSLNSWITKVKTNNATKLVDLEKSSSSSGGVRIKSSNFKGNSPQGMDSNSTDQTTSFLNSMMGKDAKTQDGLQSKLKNNVDNSSLINVGNKKGSTVNNNGANSESVSSIRLTAQKNIFSYQQEVKSIQPARSEYQTSFIQDKSGLVEKAQEKFESIHKFDRSSQMYETDAGDIAIDNLYDSQCSSNESNVDSSGSDSITLELILLYNEQSQKLDFFWKAYKSNQSS